MYPKFKIMEIGIIPLIIRKQCLLNSQLCPTSLATLLILTPLVPLSMGFSR